ncbi:MAG: hypothetical protein K6D02_04400 [Lachnospiraceae bacterium]|nr:hypothetical protein [Lachnospiraceae bacterium]
MGNMPNQSFNSVNKAMQAFTVNASKAPGEMGALEFPKEQMALFGVLKTKKSSLLTKVIVGAVLAGIWFLLLILSRTGHYNFLTKILRYITYFEGGFRTGLIKKLGGFLGRGFVCMGFISLITGLKGIKNGAKNIFSGEVIKGKNIGLMLAGAGVGLILYMFFSGYGSLRGIAIGFSGIFVSLKAIGQGNGLIRRILGLFGNKKNSNKGQGVNAKESFGNDKIQGLLAGLTLGFTLSIPVAVIPFRWTHLILGIIFLIVGIILSVATKGMNKPLALLAVFMLLAGQIMLPFNIIVASAEASGESTISPEASKNPRAKKGVLRQVVDNAELTEKQSSFAIGYEIKSNHELKTMNWCASSFDGWDCEMDVNEGDRIEIEYTLYYPKSTKGEQVGPDFIESMGRKISGTCYNNYVSGEYIQDKPVEEYSFEILYGDRDFKNAVNGDTHTMVYKVKKDKSRQNIKFSIRYHSDSKFYGEGDYSLSMNIDLSVHKKEGTDVFKFSDAGNQAGEAISEIPYFIVKGAAGAMAAGAGVAGATAAEGGKEKDNKSYQMRIYKDFGDTICPGDSRVIYARIVEVSNGVEKDRPDLTANVQIFSADGVFTVNQDGALNGIWKTATISLSKGDRNNANEGRVNFKFFGKGGTYTNSVRFFIDDPAIKLNQPNIALLACDRRGAYVGFKIFGMDLNTCKINVKMNKGSSYTAAWIKSDNKDAPNVYFAILNDINEEPGDNGTYETNVLTITVSDKDRILEESIDVYRVTEGLNFSADRIACYRLRKKESMGKQVQDLDRNDFTMSFTKVNAYILRYDEEKREVYYKPAEVEFNFEEPKEDERTKNPEEELSVMERVMELGLNYRRTNITDSMSEYTFFCEKAFLESPHRYHIVLKGRAIGEDPLDSLGNELKVVTKKHVLLESQPYRQGLECATEEDMRIQEYINELDSFIYSTAFNFMDTDEYGNPKTILGHLDSFKQSIFTKLAPYTSMLDIMLEGYDYHYGYDTLQLALIRHQIDWTIEYHKKNVLSERQRMLEKIQETAHHDANSFLITLSAAFTQINEKYIDTWGGIALRMAAGALTGGASEAIFLTMDVNKAVYQSNEHKLLSDRSLGKSMLAGSVPIFIEVVSAGVMKVGVNTIVSLPAGVKADLGKWASKQTGKFVQKIPKSIRGLANCPKKFYKWASLRKEELLSLHYDPKSKCLIYYQAAKGCDTAVDKAAGTAFKYIRGSKGGVKSPVSTLKGLAHDAAELRASAVYKNYKKAVDAFNANPTPEAEAVMKRAYFDMQQDSLAINKLNMGSRTGEAIEKGVRKADKYIEMFNRNQNDYLKAPSEDLIKDNLLEEALKKGYRKEDIEVFYATGNKTAANLKTGMDIDISPRIKTKDGKVIYFSQADTDNAVAKAWSKTTGTSYDDAKELIAKYKGRAVTPEDPEYYQQINKVLTGGDISDEALEMNMKEGMYKMTHEYDKAQKLFEEVVSDPSRLKNASKELEDVLSRNLPKEGLSKDAKALMNGAEAQVECIHQVDKIRDIYENYNIKGKAMGNADAIGDKQRVFGKLSKQVENQGVNHINLGEYDHIMETKLGGYKNNATELMKCAKEATVSARGLNEAATKKVANNLGHGAVAGVTGAINSSINNNK